MFQQCSNLRTIDRRSVTDFLTQPPPPHTQSHTYTHTHTHSLSPIQNRSFTVPLVDHRRGDGDTDREMIRPNDRNHRIKTIGSPASYIHGHDFDGDDVVRTPLFDRMAATFFLPRYFNQMQELRHPDLNGENRGEDQAATLAHTSSSTSLSSSPPIPTSSSSSLSSKASSPHGYLPPSPRPIEEHSHDVVQPDPTARNTNNDTSVTPPYPIPDANGDDNDAATDSREKQVTALRALAVSAGLRRTNGQLRHLTLRLSFSLLQSAAQHARVRVTWEGRMMEAAAQVETGRTVADAVERERIIFEKRMLQEKQR